MVGSEGTLVTVMLGHGPAGPYLAPGPHVDATFLLVWQPHRWMEEEASIARVI